MIVVSNYPDLWLKLHQPSVTYKGKELVSAFLEPSIVSVPSMEKGDVWGGGCGGMIDKINMLPVFQ